MGKHVDIDIPVYKDYVLLKCKYELDYILSLKFIGPYRQNLAFFLSESIIHVELIDAFA